MGWRHQDGNKITSNRPKTSSKPTVWDGDSAFAIFDNVSSLSSKPTVWDGDTGTTFAFSMYSIKSSKPTVWDGDSLCSKSKRAITCLQGFQAHCVG